jgi:hypothetical protein
MFSVATNISLDRTVPRRARPLRGMNRWTSLPICTVALGIFALLSGPGMEAKPIQPIRSSLYINYSAKPDAEDLVAFDFYILDSEAAVDL